MKLAQKVLLVFALLLVIGGIQGMVVAESKASLIAGVVSGAAILLSRWLLGARPQIGFGLGLIVSLALLGRFGSVAAKDGLTMWPGGVVIFFSVVTIVVLIKGFLEGREGSSEQHQDVAEDGGDVSSSGSRSGEGETGKVEADDAGGDEG